MSVLWWLVLYNGEFLVFYCCFFSFLNINDYNICCAYTSLSFSFMPCSWCKAICYFSGWIFDTSFSCYFSLFGLEEMYPFYRSQRTSGDPDASLGSLIEVLSSFVGLFWLMSLHCALKWKKSHFALDSLQYYIGFHWDSCWRVVKSKGWTDRSVFSFIKWRSNLPWGLFLRLYLQCSDSLAKSPFYRNDFFFCKCKWNKDPSPGALANGRCLVPVTGWSLLSVLSFEEGMCLHKNEYIIGEFLSSQKWVHNKWIPSTEKGKEKRQLAFDSLCWSNFCYCDKILEMTHGKKVYFGLRFDFGCFNLDGMVLFWGWADLYMIVGVQSR